MVKRKITWTIKANSERKEILEYWIKRNKSKAFSIRLNLLIIENLKLISSEPTIGKKTDIENVRIRIIRNYLLIYEIKQNEIIVLSIWDSRRNPTSYDI